MSPVAQASREERLAKILDSLLTQIRDGQRPSVEDSTRDDPDLAEAVARLLPTMALVEQVKADEESLRATRPAQPPEPFPRPERLGDYRIIREIGRGGMGVVYEAEQESLGRRVALKVLVGHSLLDPKHVRRFEREARAAAQLHHTNIVPVFGVGDDQGLHYIVMQYIAGHGLDEVIGQLRKLRAEKWFSAHRNGNGNGVATTNQATDSTIGDHLSQADRRYWYNVARIGRQVAEALAYAHRHGVVHRDVKPSNLLLESDGTMWVTDFGLARLRGQDDLTQSGDVLGTLRYIAPESFRGDFDERSDLFSLGLTLYEMCTLRPARSAETREELVRDVMDGQPLALSRINPDVPADLETIIHKAIDVEPHGRYQTAAEMAADLDRFMADRPIRARRINVAERCWRWCRRNPALAGITSLATVIVLATTISAFAWISHSRDEALAALEAKNEALKDTETERKKAETERQAAENARQRAQENAQRAHEYMLVARKAVNDFLVILAADNQLKASGLEPLRKSLLEMGVRFYDTLVDIQGDEIELEFGRANAYHRLAGLMWEVGSAESAIEIWFKSRSIFERLAAKHPGDPRFQIGLSHTYGGVGEVEIRLRRFEGALRSLTRSHDLRRDVAKRHPASIEYQSLLADSLAALGRYHERRGQPQAAEKLHKQALELNQALARRLPTNLYHRTKVGDSYLDLSAVYINSRRFKEAEAACRSALEVYVELRQRRPDAPEPPEVLAATHGNLGTILLAARRLEEAEGSLKVSVDLYRSLMIQRPGIRRYPGFLAGALERLGSFYYASKKPDLGRKSFDEALDLRRMRIDGDADAQRYKLQLAETLTDFGTYERTAGETARAQKLLGEACDVLERMCRRWPDDQEYVVRLLRVLPRMAATQTDSKQPEQAAATWRKTIALRQPIVDRENPESARVRLDQAADYGNLARIARGQKAYEESLGLYGHALAQVKTLTEKSVERDRDRVMRAIHHGRATTEHEMGRFREAAESWRAAVALASADDAKWLRANLAKSLLRSGDHQAAVAEIESVVAATTEDPHLRFDAAFIRAAAAGAISNDKSLSDPDRKQLAEECAAASLAHLKKLAAAGQLNEPTRAKNLRTNSEWNSLRANPAFAAIVAALPAESASAGK
jgi:tetratricopeptide (TPR) repeat protein/tRNA A-37 threonylcarbamoyl transferase component Bud32